MGLSREQKQKADAFITDLESLYRKHGFVLETCGCCGGAWVALADTSEDTQIEPLIAHLRDELGS